MRSWIVWAVGLAAYIVAVLDRTTLGVSGMQAAQRFSAGPGVLSTFVVLQVIVYSGCQIPAGVLLDRFGSRALIVSGASLMAAGQFVLALTGSLPMAIAARAVVGLGDSVMFISVLRLVSYWFAPRRVPLVTQLTYMCGQLGQVLSAVPFLAILLGAGWTAAYTSAAAVGVLSAALGLALVRNAPKGHPIATEGTTLRGTVVGIKAVWSRPGTRLGFFTHLSTPFSLAVFALMWGVPYLTKAQGLSIQLAGALLTVSVVAAIASGLILGILTGHHPHRRSTMALGIVAANIVAWTIVLALPGRAPLWLLVVLIIVISVGGPASMIGLDFARTFNTSATLGTAKGIVNMAGSLAGLLVMQAMGMILEITDDYSFDWFRLAWTVQYPVWALGIVGIVVTRRKALLFNVIEEDIGSGDRRPTVVPG
ncbi:MFS transporter [Mycobacterium kansasii]|uniref:Lysosomal dipeptide transporter MFSD1 n=1 Tax=Mycobacterium attenuatum TaxID=2341086 RepID=A0A498PV50_9MYCO|nr:MFS transporter [Mycobacterium attenuatum]ORB86129.1 MFS transporter [Mycobacterium kansasii]VBA36699.1 putative galactarate transporter [Mycobacterium attenuatum]